MDLALGIDVGTTGVRMAVIDRHVTVHASVATPMPAPDIVEQRPKQKPDIWWRAVEACFDQLPAALAVAGQHMEAIEALAVDGTTGTLLLADADLRPVTPALMYNSSGFEREADIIAAVAPKGSIARGRNSALARLLHLQAMDERGAGRHALHQADWIAGRLMNCGGQADENNVLKLGYDLIRREWPGWLGDAGVRMALLPEVHEVGQHMGFIAPDIAARFGLSTSTRVIAGTTDSTAAFLASGARQIGEAVTSIGTTLAVKLLTEAPVTDPSRGVYSHRIGFKWLAGGASNTGGGVLLKFFDRDQLAAMEPGLRPDEPTGLDYYPLSAPGERFPIDDPDLQPRLTPRPESDIAFFQAMLEGISEIEWSGYAVLQALGAPELKRVHTAGGGAKNEPWAKIRERRLGVPVIRARNEEAAVGVARLAAGLLP